MRLFFFLCLILGVVAFASSSSSSSPPSPLLFHFKSIASFSARTGHTLVSWHGTELLLLGGDDGVAGSPHVKNDIWRSRDGGRSWELLVAEAPWAARELHVSVASASAVYVIAGGSEFYSFPDVWRSMDGGRHWELRSHGVAPFGVRTYAASCAIGDEIYLVGGSNGVQAVSDVWRSSDGGATWTKVSDGGFRARLGHQLVCLEDGTMTMMGGMVDEAVSGVLSDEVLRSDDRGRTWKLLSGGGAASASHFSPRAQFAAVQSGATLLVLGGLTYGPQALSDICQSVDGGHTWTAIHDNELSARYGHQIALLKSGAMVLAGGSGKSGQPSNEVYSFAVAAPDAAVASAGQRGKIRGGVRAMDFGGTALAKNIFLYSYASNGANTLGVLPFTPSFTANTFSYYFLNNSNIFLQDSVPQTVLVLQSDMPLNANFTQTATVSFQYQNFSWNPQPALTVALAANGAQTVTDQFDLSTSTGIISVKVEITDGENDRQDYFFYVRNANGSSHVPAALQSCTNTPTWSVSYDSSSTCNLQTGYHTVYYICLDSVSEIVFNATLGCCVLIPQPTPPLSAQCASTPAPTTATAPTGTTTTPYYLPPASGPSVYAWVFVQGSLCKGICGSGTQLWVPQCVDDFGQSVAATACTNAGVSKPANQYLSCSNAPCNPLPVVYPDNSAPLCSSIVVTDAATGNALTMLPAFQPLQYMYGLNVDLTGTTAVIITAATSAGSTSGTTANYNFWSLKPSIVNSTALTLRNNAASSAIPLESNAVTNISVTCQASEQAGFTEIATSYRVYTIVISRGQIYKWVNVPSGICSQQCQIVNTGTTPPTPYQPVNALCVDRFGQHVVDALCIPTPKPTFPHTNCGTLPQCSQNANLLSLTLSNVPLTWALDTQYYTVTAPCTSSYTQLQLVKQDPMAKASYTVNTAPSIPIESNGLSAGIPILNTVTYLAVTMETENNQAGYDGGEATWFFSITSSGCVSTPPPTTTTTTTAPTTPNLCSVLLQSLSIPGLSACLTPTFNPSSLNYAVTLGTQYAGTSFSVSAAAQSSNTLVEIRTVPNPFVLYSAGYQATLDAGANYLEILVTSTCPNAPGYQVYSVALQVGAAVTGDPQITGLQGQDFQVHGTPEDVYNMVTHPDYQVNSRFIFLGKGASRCMDKYTQCWTHPGTYIDSLGFNLRSHRVKIQAGKYEDGLRVYVDDNEVSPGEKIMQMGDGMFVEFNNRREAFVHTPLFVYSAVNSDVFLNQKVQLLDDTLMRNGAVQTKAGYQSSYPSFPLHGILGQTWKNIVYHRGSGPQIEGHVDDYRVGDQDLFGDDFYFNLFHN